MNNGAILISRKGGRPKESSTMPILENKSLKEKAVMKICMLYARGKNANIGSLEQGGYTDINDAV